VARPQRDLPRGVDGRGKSIETLPAAVTGVEGCPDQAEAAAVLVEPEPLSDEDDDSDDELVELLELPALEPPRLSVL
jgi:hypothetical protein